MNIAVLGLPSIVALVSFIRSYRRLRRIRFSLNTSRPWIVGNMTLAAASYALTGPLHWSLIPTTHWAWGWLILFAAATILDVCARVAMRTWSRSLVSRGWRPPQQLPQLDAYYLRMLRHVADKNTDWTKAGPWTKGTLEYLDRQGVVVVDWTRGPRECVLPTEEGLRLLALVDKGKA